MVNLSQKKREKMLSYLNSLLDKNPDDESIRAINEIKNQLQDKKFGLVWEEHEEDVEIKMKDNIPVFREIKDRRIMSSESLPYNFILEGDNLQSLHLLEKTHKGRIDLIYIDPPYNTGAKTWKYDNDYVDINDSYRHSKWISMIASRLRIAKRLLSKDGALVFAIDENEQATTGLLLEELFDKTNYNIDCITVIHNPGGIQGSNFSYCHEYAYFVYPKRSGYISKEKRTDVEPQPFRDWGKENSKRQGSPNCFYPIILSKDMEVIGFGDVPDDNYHPAMVNEYHDDEIYIWPIDNKGVERRWRFARDTVEGIKNELVAVSIKGIINIKRAKQHFTRKTVWSDERYSANNSGSQLLAKIIPTKFPFPKSLYLVKDCISACEQTKDGIILDFYAGSGTTAHAVLQLNAEDGGNRKFIICTNNENEICETVTYPRVKTVITGVRYDGSEYSEKIPANLKYYRCDWIPAHPEDSLLSPTLCLHIREMIELQNHLEIDDEKKVVILNRRDVSTYIINQDNYDKVQEIWLNERIILTPDEIKLLSGKIVHQIPRAYFGQELMEVAE